MTYRSEIETLRRRVRELEASLADEREAREAKDGSIGALRRALQARETEARSLAGELSESRAEAGRLSAELRARGGEQAPPVPPPTSPRSMGVDAAIGIVGTLGGGAIAAAVAGAMGGPVGLVAALGAILGAASAGFLVSQAPPD